MWKRHRIQHIGSERKDNFPKFRKASSYFCRSIGGLGWTPQALLTALKRHTQIA